MVVVAGVVKDTSKIMIARRLSHKSNGCLWEFPGGKLEHGESDQDALIREFKEEFGMEISIDQFIGSFPFVSKTLTIDLRVWYAAVVTMPVFLSDHDKVEWVSVEELKQFQFSPADVPVVEQLCNSSLIRA